MKRKLSIFSLLILPLMFLNGCNAFSNGHESVKPSSSSLDSTSYSSQEDYEKALYNRIILDYYEQKVLKSGTITKNGDLFYFQFNDGRVWRLGDGHLSQRSNITIDDIQIEELVGKSDKGAYVFCISYQLFTYYYPYEYQIDTSAFIDGNQLLFENDFMPLVWYKGLLLYPAEAYSLGLITLNEINCYVDSLTHKGQDPAFSSYDSSIKPLEIESKYDIGSNAHLSIILNDYVTHLNNNNVTSFDNKPIDKNDVHIVDSFGIVNGKEVLSIVADNVALQCQTWSNSIVIDGISINPFYHYEPTIYYNHHFYSFSEASENGMLTKNDAELIVGKFNSN